MMSYIKLFLPILIIVLFFIASEIFFIGFNPTIAIIVKTISLIYYLRLDNSKTPLLNMLTLTILCMSVSEYLIQFEPRAGQILFAASNLAFGITYAIRQRLKEKKDRRMKLKMTAVFLFALTNITALDFPTTTIPVVIGWLLLVGVYFFDRLFTISEQKRTAQQP